MAKKFKKTGNVDFSSNPNINQEVNGNLVIDSPTFERHQILIHADNTVDLSFKFYETDPDSNPSIRTFRFSDPGPSINAAVNVCENLIRNMSELQGSTEV